MAEDTQIRRKCDQYEKLTNCFWNLEKQRGSENTIKKLAADKEFTDQNKYSRTQRVLQNFFKIWEPKTEIEMENFFSDVDTPNFSEN